MESKSFIHEHPLVFFEEWGEHVSGYEYYYGSSWLWSIDNETEDTEHEHVPCSVCRQPISTQFSECTDCKFFIHKTCYDQLQLNISHPFHDNHALTLLKEVPTEYQGVDCNLCFDSIRGFLYNCLSCQFNLHIHCTFLPQFFAGDLPKHKLFIHEHPLVIFENFRDKVELKSSCSACSKKLLGTCFYTCPDCKFFIHKSCSEPPLEIKHPFHDKHLLTLVPNPQDIKPQPVCNFCQFRFFEFECFYRCPCCHFHLHIKCAFLQQTLTEDFPKLNHFSHEHQLISIEKLDDEVNYIHCSVCLDPSQGSNYRCLELDCVFYLDKKCAEIPREINLPFHSFNDKLNFIVLQKPKSRCTFCHRPIEKFAYRHFSRKFIFHIKCALLLSQFTDFDRNHRPKLYPFGHLHTHPLIFMEKHENELRQIDCGVCKSQLSDSIYSCLRSGFHIHKKCAKLPTEINHPSHHHCGHHLTLQFHTSSLWTHGIKYCNLCQKASYLGTEEMGYACFSCKFYIHNQCVSPPQTIENKSHQHRFILFWRECPSPCDACGEETGHARYLCLPCNLMVHEKCISLPQNIKISVHDHPIRHTYFSGQRGLEKRICRICYKEVKAEYGSYYCLDLHCNYIFHVNCATYGGLYTVIELENEDRKSSEGSSSDTVLGKHIKHFSHNHKLVFSEEIMDESCCDGCALLILSPSYNCSQPWCNFSLHRTCAQIQKEEKHWTEYRPHIVCFGSFKCSSCNYLCKGFAFKLGEDTYVYRRCHKLPFETIHEGHEGNGHLLCLDLDDYHFQLCSACGESTNRPYKCREEGCNFFLCCRCLTRPLKVQHKFDEHPLKLTYEDPNKDDDPLQHICWICEDRRDPKLWFYRCDECDFDAHPECFLGEYPFIKRGSFYTDGDIDHPHPLIFFQCEKYPYPKCNECGEPCKDLALKCTKSNCNFAMHVHEERLWRGESGQKELLSVLESFSSSDTAGKTVFHGHGRREGDYGFR